jgi:D-glycero-alpha-D-manno-heptose 1-phosphate guanylyltransferase
MFDVIILAGGMGTRLRSVVSEVPKCMAPVAGQPFLYYLLEYLKPYKPGKVVLSLGYMSEKVIDWVNTSARILYEYPIEWVIEETPLGTGGGIKLALSRCSSQEVCILNGDTMFKVPLDVLCRLHQESSVSISLALKPMTDFSRYGTVSIAQNQTITEFNEKRYCSRGLINGGIYFISRNSGIFDGMPEKFSFEKDILESFVRKGELKGFSFDNYFIDIGVPEDYEKSQTDFKDFR